MEVSLSKTKYCPEKPLFTSLDLRRLIVPLVIEQILATTVGMVDTMMISTVGEAAVSGVSLVDMISVMMNSIFAALATGGAVVISQCVGAQLQKKANDSASQLVVLSAGLGLIVGGFCLAFAHFIMANLFGALAPDVYSAGVLYLQISALSYPFLALYNAGAAIFRSTGNSKLSMKVSAIMNIINVTGNAFCLFVLDWDILGVAIPTAVSRVFAGGMMLYCMMRNLGTVRVEPSLKFSKELVGRILRVGLPSAFENSLFQSGRLVVAGMVASFGTVQITANAVSGNLCSIACIPGTAFSLAMIPIVGRAIGAGDIKQAVYYTKKVMLWVYSISGAWNLIIFLLVPVFLNFYTLSAETAHIAWQLVAIHSLCGILLWPASFTLPNALRAANDVKFPLVVSMLSMIFVRIVMSYILCIGLGWGAVGVSTAMVIDWVVRVTFFVARFASGKWKIKYAEQNKLTV